ncbi:MAG: UDP-N-acetylmuramate--L-alanine ligase [Chloroflexi bacterium]|nr:UDP-N-acetylmuramate--L-alanine ligase [Chloroflexota bacterium]
MIPPRVHLIGIGGIGLSAIARVLIARGVQVSGSDLHASPITDELATLGAQIHIGHRAENIDRADLILVTSAAPAENPEVIEARRRGIRIARRYDFFAELTQGKKTIAVAGTHGKTTTTGMIATILTHAGLDPTAIIGGIIPELNGNARAGKGKYFVVEADEYDRAFLGLRPSIAVVTSIEMDHPDIFRDLNEVAKAFREFIALVPHDGLIVGCGESERVLRELGETRAVRYGFGEENDWRASDIHPNARGGSDFVVWRKGAHVGNYQLQIPGTHNVLNALAALVVADAVGIDLQIARETLADFRGAARRFEIKGEFHGIAIVDDYAHHPSEIRATLAAARARYPGRPLWAAFQPHTFSRTRALLDEFAAAFDDADHVILTDIFAARERDDHSISSRDLIARMTHRDARFIASFEEIVEFLVAKLQSGDVLITLGAGDVYRLGEQLGVRLASQGAS